ncbi:hypothetical protein ANCDUO_03141 [Ancylostoma duodenale]|uniref:Uncharacterized protein n=1 Tax=Ancylostoma duodenale TaxID=51022 RepID=A0A0C2D9W5_9BILA|nr:hypothetical protein ANCDUO_03141 [Ancylostoma duodenale]
MARTLEVDEKSIIQWFRDVLVDCYNTTRRESEDLTQRRLVGGIQDGTKLVFVEVTDDRSSANLNAIIQRHVIPGAVVRTDMWRGYSSLTNLQPREGEPLRELRGSGDISAHATH